MFSCSIHLSSIQVNYLPFLDLSSLVPTPSTIIKKAKSRTMDKENRGRNRLSHTSAPLYYAKSKRPATTDLDGVGTTNRLPGGQQPASRRQRSLRTKGKSTNTAQTWHFLHTHNMKYANTKAICLRTANKAYVHTVQRNATVIVLIVRLFLRLQEEGQLPLWLLYISWRQTKKSQLTVAQHLRAAGTDFSLILNWHCTDWQIKEKSNMKCPNKATVHYKQPEQFQCSLVSQGFSKNTAGGMNWRDGEKCCITRRFKVYQRCSIRFRYGDCEGWNMIEYWMNEFFKDIKLFTERSSGLIMFKFLVCMFTQLQIEFKSWCLMLFFSVSPVTQYHSMEREILPSHKSLCAWRECTSFL